MKDLLWMGSSFTDLCKFTVAVRKKAGYQLHLIQIGDDPDDWKPMATIGSGVREIRIHENGEYRIIYLAKYPEGIYILHAFLKKTEKTPLKAIEIAKTRFSQIETLRKNK